MNFNFFYNNFINNKNIQLSVIGIFFILWFFLLGKKCPCGYKNINKRKENGDTITLQSSVYWLPLSLGTS